MASFNFEKTSNLREILGSYKRTLNSIGECKW